MFFQLKRESIYFPPKKPITKYKTKQCQNGGQRQLSLLCFNPFKTKLNWKVIWNFENTVELVVRAFAALCLIFQHDEPYLQYFSAIGIFFAFLGRFLQQNY
mgnify:CR=1 FL=1